MIGTTVQYALYALFLLTMWFAAQGAVLTYFLRRGREVPIEGTLAALALIAAASPYVGLFGTVWHIIEALSGIGSGNLNVAAIARPIGEALYATLWGLGCAIPALIAHRVLLVLLPDDEADSTEAA